MSSYLSGPERLIVDKEAADAGAKAGHQLVDDRAAKEG